MDRIELPVRRPGRPARAAGIFAHADGEPMRHPVIQGFATLFDKLYIHGSRLEVFTKGAFSDTVWDNQEKFCYLDHDSNYVVGSTRSNLEFERTINGLAFRLDLRNHPKANVIANTVANGGRACASVGIDILESEVLEIEGHKVRFTTKAKLREVSLVRQGAVTDACAWLEDLGEKPEHLAMSARSNAFMISAKASNIQATGRRIIDALRQLPID